MKHLFGNRAFVLLMVSDFMQNIGIWIRNMALLFFIMEQSNHDPVAVSLLTVIEYAPIFVISMVGGVLADRWRPKRTMIWGDILSFISILLILFVVYAGYWQAVFAVTLVSAVVSQFSQPSSMKIIKRCLPDEHVPAATALSQTSMSLFIILGPMVGTTIYQAFGLQASLISLLILFGASAIVLAFLPSTVDEPSKDSESAGSFVKDMKAGFAYIGSSRLLKVLLVVYVLLALGSGLVQPLDIFVITERLQLEMSSVQWFTALEGLGMLIGGVIAAVIAGKVKGSYLLFAGLAFLGLSTFVEVLSQWPILTGSMRFVTGVLMAMAQTVLMAVMMQQVEEKFIGRLNGVMTPIFTGMLLIGSGLTGWYMSVTSIVVVYFTAGALFLLSSFISMKLPIAKVPVQETEAPVRVETAAKA
ncbi:MFS transporter [Paenibacillus sp. FSL H8-0457]|uniref:MFS transporter n=1 Tax=Paenibacillus TaxID=44249 RepID=UPI00017891A6|nr:MULTISPECIES: MFS transporter [Paenibacillus]ACX68167.1 major facilitator superfamily MFS_1 [Paenibacillus sp. Y412MC10]ETT65055.1 major facilitator superfamily protein [Paenibacillus sp. FSL H8-457]QOT09733.1 MFS transporter [Paenibacillus sp. JNUCC-32]WFB58257.1 MFS transporter [Paenibacillus sp. BR1-192]GIP07041.1 MFS transporter [Paenibacillus lautus]